MDKLIQINNLCAGYYKDTVIKDISLSIRKEEFIGIIGPNGSGKSTLLRTMSRVLIPQKGAITFEDTDITKLNLKEICRKIAFVGQDTLINFSFTVWEIVLMGRIPHLKRMQKESKQDFAIAENALALTDTLHLKEKYINELSAGERQRVVIAKALTQEPTVLFLDEPTSHLDIGHQIQILDLLRQLNRQNGLTIIIVMHDLNLTSEYCSRIILFKDGSVFKDGTPEEVLTYQNIEYVYKTIVVVNQNPISRKPYVLLATRRK